MGRRPKLRMLRILANNAFQHFDVEVLWVMRSPAYLVFRQIADSSKEGVDESKPLLDLIVTRQSE